jgi:hypothetical protein
MKKYDILAAILGIIDLTLLAITAPSSPIGGNLESIVNYLLDIVVITLIAYTFGRKVKECTNRRRYIISNWYAILGMIPVMVFVYLGQSSDYDGFVAVGIMLRLLGIVYLTKQLLSYGERSYWESGIIYRRFFLIQIVTHLVCSCPGHGYLCGRKVLIYLRNSRDL